MYFGSAAVESTSAWSVRCRLMFFRSGRMWLCLVIMSSSKWTWTKVPCARSELNLAMVLKNGQSFRWTESPESSEADKVWVGVMHHRVWKMRQNSESHFEFMVIGRFENCNPKEKIDEEALRDYFQLDKVNLKDLYRAWTEKDEYFRRVTADGKFSGIRVLRQDPFECLFSFICSQNNSIKRISAMVNKLCSSFGAKLSVEYENYETVDFYDFPKLEDLVAPGVTNKLKDLGFGYRSAFIGQSAIMIQDDLGGVDWVYGLRNKTVEKAKMELMSLPGVGSKVADCVLLMSLDKSFVVPVDTHVLQITARHYLPSLAKKKSIAPRLHDEISKYYREKFGEFAGWAQSVLFSSDLKQFSPHSEGEESPIQTPADVSVGGALKKAKLHV